MDDSKSDFKEPNNNPDIEKAYIIDVSDFKDKLLSCHNDRVAINIASHNESKAKETEDKLISFRREVPNSSAKLWN